MGLRGKRPYPPLVVPVKPGKTRNFACRLYFDANQRAGFFELLLDQAVEDGALRR